MKIKLKVDYLDLFLMNCRFFSSCFEAKTQVNFMIDLEVENDDISKLKTTACSNDENDHYPKRNLLFFIQILNDNIDKNQDLLYISEASSNFDKKIDWEALDKDKLINIRINEKTQVFPLFHASAQCPLKKIALNESY